MGFQAFFNIFSGNGVFQKSVIFAEITGVSVVIHMKKRVFVKASNRLKRDIEAFFRIFKMLNNIMIDFGRYTASVESAKIENYSNKLITLLGKYFANCIKIVDTDSIQVGVLKIERLKRNVSVSDVEVRLTSICFGILSMVYML